MANQENVCSHLEVRDFYEEHKNENKDFDPLTNMLNMQKWLQEDCIFPKVPDFVVFNNKKFADMTMQELSDFLLKNEHALVDELHEHIDALGGIKDGIGSASWKYWKKDHKEIPNKTLNDLSENDLKEYQMEAIDIMHFVLNLFLCSKLNSKGIYNMYMSKHAENVDRQKRGY